MGNLKPLKHITVLSLNGSNIQGTLSPDLLSEMTDLKELYLHDNKLTKVPELNDNLELHILTLHGNQITQANFTAALSKLTYLKELTLSGNMWSCTCSFLLAFKDEVAALALANILVDSKQIGCEPDTEDGITISEPVASQSG